MTADASTRLLLRAAGVRPSPDLFSRWSAATEERRPRWPPALRSAPVWCSAALPFEEAREGGSGPEGGQQHLAQVGWGPGKGHTGGELVLAEDKPHPDAGGRARAHAARHTPRSLTVPGLSSLAGVLALSSVNAGVSHTDLVFSVDRLPWSGSAEPPNILDSVAAVAAGSAGGRWQSLETVLLLTCSPVVGKSRGLPPPRPALGRVSAQTRFLPPGVLPLRLLHPGRGTEPPGTCCSRQPAGLSCGPCTWRPGRHGPGAHEGHGPSAAEQMWLSRDGAGIHWGVTHAEGGALALEEATVILQPRRQQPCRGSEVPAATR